MKILVVCLGNICRTPLAQGILEKKINDNGLDWEVDSAGTSNYHVGEKPDYRSIATAKKHGLDISHQRSRQIKPQDLDYYDLILAMDESNLHNISRLCINEGQKQKVRLILSYLEDYPLISVPDPYYGEEGFEEVYHMLEEACEHMVAAYK
jgi:protein-tyrosine phosphatase